MPKPVLIFPAGMPRSLAYLERAVSEGTRVIGSSSLLYDPAQGQYPGWVYLPYVTAPEFDMRMHWSIDDLAGYVATWSASRRYSAALGTDPVAPFMATLRDSWGDGRRDVRWPVTVLAGRV